MMDASELVEYAQRQLDAFFDRFDVSQMATSSALMFNDLRQQYSEMVVRLAAVSNNPHVVIDRLVQYLWEADAELRAEGMASYNLRLLFSTIADRLLEESPDDSSEELVLLEPAMPCLN